MRRLLTEPLYRAFIARASGLGYTVVEPEDKAQKTEIYRDKQLVCDLMPDGEIRGKGADENVKQIDKLLADMKPAYFLYTDAAYLPFEGVRDYKLLCEFNDFVLAAALEENNELSFATWQYDYGRENVRDGDYYDNDYAAAKEDFAIRCGLLDKKKIFSEEEILCLDTACSFGDYGDYLDRLGESKEEYNKLMDKLKSLLPPELLDQIPEQEDESEMEVFL